MDPKAPGSSLVPPVEPRRRGPGRPRKVRPGVGPTGASAAAAVSNKPISESSGQNKVRAPVTQSQGTDLAGSEVATASASSSKRSSPDTDEFVPPTKRHRSASAREGQSTILSTASGPLPPISERKVRSSILPARRSTRNATVQSTQISEGTLRPPGPPHLEAALGIALRNLESDMWRYLWAYYKRHPRGPLPTPSAIKAACPRVLSAAEAVDKADRELEDAIDDIMEANSKKKGRPPARSLKPAEKSGVAGGNEGRRIDGDTGEPSAVVTPDTQDGTGITVVKNNGSTSDPSANDSPNKSGGDP